MKKRYTTLAAAVLMSASTIASAQGYYVFGSVGQSNFDTGSNNISGLDVDENDTLYNFGAGYQFNDYLSAEVGYTDLGEAKFETTAPLSGTVLGSTVTIDGKLGADITGFFIGVKAQKDVTEQVSIFGRAGFLNWESEGSFSGTITIDGDTFTGSTSTEVADGTDPYISLGVSYSVTENVALDVQASRYMIDYDGVDMDIDTFTAGVTYSF